LYTDHLQPAQAPAHLSAAQRAVLGCMYTRHHHGYVRQRWAREIVAVEESFVVPFVVQMLGEYVVEIITDLCQRLPQLEDPTSDTAYRYGRFLDDNPGYFFLTRQRVASYWDCYHRRRYLHPAHYPGHVLLARLDQAARASRQRQARAPCNEAG
jgi:hypothetical protein